MRTTKTILTYAIIAALVVALASSYITSPVLAQGAGLKFKGPVTCRQNADNSVTCSGNVSGAGTGATVTVDATGTSSSGCTTGKNKQGDPPGQQTNIRASGTAPVTPSETGGSTPFSVTTNAVQPEPQPSCPSANMSPYSTVDFTSAIVTVKSPNKQDIFTTVPVN
jgi:hypothetical protein